MYNILQHAHSGLRWLLLLVIVIAIVQSLSQWMGKKEWNPKKKTFILLTLIFTHLQFLIGLILYFISPEVVFNENTMADSRMRFYAVEHISMMIIAVILITLGYRQIKRSLEGYKIFRNVFWYYLIALIIMLVSIPWPFRDLGGAWF